jgi:hypothetical protein
MQKKITGTQVDVTLDDLSGDDVAGAAIGQDIRNRWPRQDLGRIPVWDL